MSSDSLPPRHRHRQPDAVAPAPQRGRVVRDDRPADGVRGERLGQGIAIRRRRVGLGQDEQPGAVRDRTREPRARGAQRAAVEHFDDRRDRACRHQPRHRLGPRRGIGVERRDRQRDGRRGHQPQPGRGDDAERPLGPDQQPAQVVPRDVLAHRTPDAQQLAGRDDGLEPRHPRARDAVLEAVRTAGVRRDVAADLRLLGRARIGREAQAVLTCEPAHGVRRDSGVDLHAPLERIQGANAIQAVERDRKSVV